jgi:hypothetical protein
MRTTVATAAIAAACLLAGCGGIKAPDLFVVTRTGSGPQAHLTMLINEEGGVSCNFGPELKLSDPQIVKARAIQEELHDPVSQHRSFAAQPGSVLGYRVRDQDGSITFADNSKGQPKVLRALALLVLETAQRVCHLPE